MIPAGALRRAGDPAVQWGQKEEREATAKRPSRRLGVTGTCWGRRSRSRTSSTGRARSTRLRATAKMMATAEGLGVTESRCPRPLLGLRVWIPGVCLSARVHLCVVPLAVSVCVSACLSACVLACASARVGVHVWAPCSAMRLCENSDTQTITRGSGQPSAKPRPSSARSSSSLRSSSSSVASGGVPKGTQARGMAAHGHASSSAREDSLRHSREKAEGAGRGKGARRALSGKLAASSSAANTSASGATVGGGGGAGAGGGGAGGRGQRWAHEREQESGAGEGAAYDEVYIDESEAKAAQPAAEARDGGGLVERHVPSFDSPTRSSPHAKAQPHMFCRPCPSPHAA